MASLLEQLGGNLLNGVAQTLNPSLQPNYNSVPGVVAVPTATTTVQPGTAYYPVAGPGVPGTIFGVSYAKAAIIGFGGLLGVGILLKLLKK